MPKRKCPFGESTPLQLKTHVGFKETATKADMQEVYEKTRALLFQGANPGSRTHGRNGYALNGHSGHTHPLNGTLSGHGCVGSTEVASQQVIVKTDVCACCRKKLEKVALPCAACTRSLCGHCLQQCCVCQEMVCQFCSVLNYDSPEVRAFCFTCLPVAF